MIVVDDGSDDGSAGEALRVRRPAVHAVLRPHRGGQAVALNAGIEQARGEWIAFLDDDDLWSPKKLRAQLDAAAAAGRVLRLRVDGRRRRRGEGARVPFPRPLRRRCGRCSGGRTSCAAPSSVMARAELVRGVGGLDENLNELTDWDFFLRLADSGRPAACRELVIGYLVHPQNRRLRQDSDVAAEFSSTSRRSTPGSSAPDSRAGWRWVTFAQVRRFRAAGTYFASAVRDRDPGNALRGAAALFGERAFRERRRLVADRPNLPGWRSTARRVWRETASSLGARWSFRGRGLEEHSG